MTKLKFSKIFKVGIKTFVILLVVAFIGALLRIMLIDLLLRTEINPIYILVASLTASIFVMGYVFLKSKNFIFKK